MWQVQNKFVKLICFIVFVFMSIVSILYLDNNQLISFLNVCSAKSSLCLMIKSISCFKLLPTFSAKSNWIVFGFVLLQDCYKIIARLLPLVITSIFIRTWLCWCKMFRWFYCADTKDIVFIWFRFIVFMGYYQFLFVLVILEIKSIPGLQLRFWFLLFTLLFFDHFLVVAWVVFQLIFHIFLWTILYNHIYQVLNY